MTRPKFIDDLAGVAGGAMSALTGMRDEVEQIVRARVEEALRNMRLVRRDEFDATVELAANARAAHEDAALRIAALERRVAALERGGPGDAGVGDPGAAGVGRPGDAAPAAASDDADAHPHLTNEGGLGGPPDASPHPAT